MASNAMEVRLSPIHSLLNDKNEERIFYRNNLFFLNVGLNLAIYIAISN